MIQENPRLPKVLALSAGVGMWLFVTIVGKGNVLVIAAPLGLWLSAMLWPVPSLVGAGQGKRRRRKEMPVYGKRRVGWYLGISSMVWSGALGILALEFMDGERTEAEIEAEMERVETLVLAGQWTGALNILDAMEIPPEYPLRHAQWHHNRGVVLMQLDRPKEAAVALQRAYSYDSSDVEACVLVGRLAVRRGKFHEALEWLRRAEVAEPAREDVRRLIETAKAECEEGG